MDGERFDRLARSAAGASRRRVLRGLAGGLLAGLLALAGQAPRAQAGAGCFKRRKRCRHHTQCCKPNRCRFGRCR